MFITLSIIIVVAATILIFLQQAQFGKTPDGARLERIKRSPHYKDGAFQNLSHTPDLTEGASYYTVFKEFFFSDKRRNSPADSVPSQRTDLMRLDPKKDVLVWFGHSSYFIQIDGKRILVDPVLSGGASPLSFTTRAFKGTDPYTVEDIPEIDYLFISHDHWDHTDHATLLKLKSKVKKVICGLGTGAHFEHWGYNTDLIIETDWNEHTLLDSGFTAHTVTARHFSGRGFQRNKALWASFVLQTPTVNIFIGGDSGYDTHFLEIGKTYGPFDLVILENGQYDKSWKYIHMMPEEVLQAAKDLQARKLFPVHSSKFALANHDWDEPLRRITLLNKNERIPMITPIIGESVHLKDSTQTFSTWWEGIN